MKPRLFILSLCLLSLLGCERRELTDDDPQEGIAVRIDIDWIDLRDYRDEKQRHLKALFYPVDGGKPLERHLMNGDRERFFVPEGDYHIIVYNWRTNADIQTTRIRGREGYLTKEAYTNEVLRSRIRAEQRAAGQETKQVGAADEAIIAQPDYLYAWTTRDAPRQISFKDAKEDIVIKAPMKSKVYFYHFTVDIYNPGEIRFVESAISGTRGWVRPAMGQRSPESYSTDVHITRLNDEGNTEKARFLLRFRTFGKIEGSPNRIAVETINPDGLKETHFTKDISDIIDKINRGEIDNTEPYDISDPQNKIIITPGQKPGSGFLPPTLEEWVPVHGGQLDV